MASVLLDAFSLREDRVPESSPNSVGAPLPVFRVQNVDASIAYYLQCADILHADPYPHTRLALAFAGDIWASTDMSGWSERSKKLDAQQTR